MTDEQKKDMKKLKWVVAVVAAVILVAGAVSYLLSISGDLPRGDVVPVRAEKPARIPVIHASDGKISDAGSFSLKSDLDMEQFYVDLSGKGTLSLVTLTRAPAGGVRVLITSQGKEEFSLIVEGDWVGVDVVHLREAGRHELLFSYSRQEEHRILVAGPKEQGGFGVLFDGKGVARGSMELLMELKARTLWVYFGVPNPESTGSYDHPLLWYKQAVMWDAGSGTFTVTDLQRAVNLQPEDFTLAGVAYDMTEEEVEAILGTPKTEKEGVSEIPAGMYWKAVEYDGIDLVFIKWGKEDTYGVGEITLTSSRYKTSKGIGIGDTKEQVLAAYGEPFGLQPFSGPALIEQKEDAVLYEVDGNNQNLEFDFENGVVSLITIFSFRD